MAFKGFHHETIQFFQALSANNDKAWFEQHRPDYEGHVKGPACQFIVSMGELLNLLDPSIQAIPKINKSLFKIYRDTRFSANKIPFKEHLGIWFWSGTRKRMECSGFYFQLDMHSGYLGSGMYTFSKELLAAFRTKIQNPVKASSLLEIIDGLESKGYKTGGKTLKKMPRGMASDLEVPDLAFFTGLYAGTEFPLSSIVYSNDLLTYVFDVYKDLFPLFEWLKDEMS